MNYDGKDIYAKGAVGKDMTVRNSVGTVYDMDMAGKDIYSKGLVRDVSGMAKRPYGLIDEDFLEFLRQLYSGGSHLPMPVRGPANYLGASGSYRPMSSLDDAVAGYDPVNTKPGGAKGYGVKSLTIYHVSFGGAPDSGSSGYKGAKG